MRPLNIEYTNIEIWFVVRGGEGVWSFSDIYGASLGGFGSLGRGGQKFDFLGAFCYLFASFWRNWAHKRFQISRILILFLKPCINLQEAIDPNAIFSKSQQTIMWHRRTQETTKNYLNMVSRLWEIPSNGHGSASAHWKKNILTKRFLKVKIFKSTHF